LQSQTQDQTFDDSTTDTPCPECSNVMCALWGTCHLSDTEFAAGVADCERQRVDGGYVAEAKAETNLWSGGGEIAVDPELVSNARLALEAAVGRYEARADVIALLTAGATMRQAAVLIEAPVSVVARMFCSEATTTVDAVLRAESMLRAGAISFRSVARETGVALDAVLSIANAIGVTSSAAATRADGGGFKYTADQIAQAWDLLDDGLSLREIAERMGFGSDLQAKNAVAGMLRRNARPNGVAA
jgi:hypothetical protein